MHTYDHGIVRVRCGKPGLQWFWLLSTSALCLVINLTDDDIPTWIRLVTLSFPLIGSVFESTEIDARRRAIVKRHDFIGFLPIWKSSYLISDSDEIAIRFEPKWMSHPPSSRPSDYVYTVVLITSEGKSVRIRDYWLPKDKGCLECFSFANELGHALELPVRSEVASSSDDPDKDWVH